MTHPLLGGCALQRSHVHNNYTGNVQFKASKVYTKTAIMAEQFIFGMWPTISHILSPKQHSIRFMHIPHIGTKKKPLTEAGSQIYLYMWWSRTTLPKLCSASCVAMCYTSLTFTLTCLPHITEWYEDMRRTSLLGHTRY